jgi:energy-coupling factor transport system ATP-binding protein
VIEISALQHGLLDIPALTIAPGSTALIGLNGSGKTTLLKIIAGITAPDKGLIEIEGLPLSDVDIGWINEYPDRNLLLGKVADEIAGPLRFRKGVCKETDEKVLKAARVCGIEPLLERRTRELSGGEKVIISLVTAHITKPVLLVLDESDSHLDEESTGILWSLIERSSTKYRIWCTQDMELAACADQVILLERGRVTRSGPPREIFTEATPECLYPFSWRLTHADQL